MFIDAFLGLASAVSVGAATEITTPGYARQAISFRAAVNGVSRNAAGWSFGTFGAPAVAGRVIYDAPIGGNILFVLPHFNSRAPSTPNDAGDAGDIVLNIAALQAYPTADAFTGLLAPSVIVGLTYDVAEIVGTYSTAAATAGLTVVQLPGPVFQFVQASPLSTGPLQLAIDRGVLQARPRLQGIE